MAGVKGRSGRQTRPLTEALRKAVLDIDRNDQDGRKKLEIIVRKLVNLACDGDMEAIKEVANRLDGRAQQQVALTGEDGGPMQIVVRRLFTPIEGGGDG